MVIVYRWRYDTTYYRAVTDRYYRQVPFVLRLPTQFTLLWLLIVAVCWHISDIAPTEFVVWALLTGAVAMPVFVFLTKKTIFLKYRVRPSFDSEACYTLLDSGGTIQQKAGAASFQWTMYRLAVRFSDGILLKRLIRGHPMAPDQSLERRQRWYGPNCRCELSADSTVSLAIDPRSALRAPDQFVVRA
jgi:hypothetical protein